jgi:hypothetical protein
MVTTAMTPDHARAVLDNLIEGADRVEALVKKASAALDEALALARELGLEIREFSNESPVLTPQAFIESADFTDVLVDNIEGRAHSGVALNALVEDAREFAQVFRVGAQLTRERLDTETGS